MQIGDFGLTHLVGANAVMATDAYGSVAYMAPVSRTTVQSCVDRAFPFWWLAESLFSTDSVTEAGKQVMYP